MLVIVSASFDFRFSHCLLWFSLYIHIERIKIWIKSHVFVFVFFLVLSFFWNRNLFVRGDIVYFGGFSIIIRFAVIFSYDFNNLVWNRCCYRLIRRRLDFIRNFTTALRKKLSFSRQNVWTTKVPRERKARKRWEGTGSGFVYVQDRGRIVRRLPSGMLR